jgi:hypothetical protein
VYDGTGNSNLNSLQGTIETAQAAGYQVNGTYVTAPTDLAWERSQARGDKTGREVPETTLRDTHASVSAVLPQAAPLFDSMRLVDSTMGPLNAQGYSTGQIIATATKGNDIQVADQEAYDRFLAKANEDTTPRGRTVPYPEWNSPDFGKTLRPERTAR